MSQAQTEAAESKGESTMGGGSAVLNSQQAESMRHVGSRLGDEIRAKRQRNNALGWALLEDRHVQHIFIAWTLCISWRMVPSGRGVYIVNGPGSSL